MSTSIFPTQGEMWLRFIRAPAPASHQPSSPTSVEVKGNRELGGEAEGVTFPCGELAVWGPVSLLNETVVFVCWLTGWNHHLCSDFLVLPRDSQRTLQVGQYPRPWAHDTQGRMLAVLFPQDDLIPGHHASCPTAYRTWLTYDAIPDRLPKPWALSPPLPMFGVFTSIFSPVYMSI